MPKETKVTIIEIAEHARVAVSTVSRVLNRHEDVDDATRNKVMESVRILKYEPNLVARNLIRGAIVKLPVLPTALFSNDEMSIGAMRAIREKGLKIPDDIAIVGFDDNSLASHVHPALTTICVPKKSLGKLAAKKLFECLEDPERHQHSKTVIPVELVIRESCGANLRE